MVSKSKNTNNQKIQSEINQLKKSLLNFRFQKANGQAKSPTKVKDAKKSIARLKTMLGKEKNA